MSDAAVLREAPDGSIPARSQDPRHRKHATLRRASPSHVRSIADAVDIKDGDVFLVCPDWLHPGWTTRRTRVVHARLPVPVALRDGAWAHPLGCPRRGNTACGMAVIRSTNPRLTFGDAIVGKQTLVATWTRTLDGSVPDSETDWRSRITAGRR